MLICLGGGQSGPRDTTSGISALMDHSVMAGPGHETGVHQVESSLMHALWRLAHGSEVDKYGTEKEIILL